MFKHIVMTAVLSCAVCISAFGQDDLRKVEIKKISGDCDIITADGQSFRLAGVEFPEVPIRERLARRDRGIVVDESVEFVRSALGGKTVNIAAVAGHGNGAVKLYLLPDGVLFNTLVIEQGRATAARATELGTSAEFKAAQDKAMVSSSGLWADKAKGATSAHMGVSSIDNQARTVDFVSRYQGPAEESE